MILVDQGRREMTTVGGLGRGEVLVDVLEIQISGVRRKMSGRRSAKHEFSPNASDGSGPKGACKGRPTIAKLFTPGVSVTVSKYAWAMVRKPIPPEVKFVSVAVTVLSCVVPLLLNSVAIILPLVPHCACTKYHEWAE